MNNIFKPKNSYQSECIRTIIENRIAIIYGYAGTGKTACSIGLACEKFLNGDIKRIVFTRPFVNTGKGIGWLAGSKEDKTLPYFLPALDEFEKYFSRQDIINLRKDKILIIEPLEFMRGSNFYDAYMILGECQNATKEQIRMFVSRMSSDSTKCILEGDINQCDLYNCDYSRIIERFRENPIKNISVFELPHEAIVRSKIISAFIRNTDDL